MLVKRTEVEIDEITVSGEKSGDTTSYILNRNSIY